MFEAFFASLDQSPLALLLRGSIWIYPAVNTCHILGIALLVGSIVPLDLRLIGIWSRVPLAPLLRVLSTTAALGIGLTLISGMLLFITRASAYMGSTVFLAKMIIVTAGLVNGLIVRRVLSPNNLPVWVDNDRVPPTVRTMAGFSLLTWTMALVLGRLIGYVH
ncbi:MAG: hypothetical protein QNJ17_09340 [Desulfocapsaceae bacterium]|nr:hypothetical protein [Desulfocapsaceae bacterium]